LSTQALKGSSGDAPERAQRETPVDSAT